MQFEHRLPKLSIVDSEVRHVCYQRNLGASFAISDLILFMDADNRLPTYFLQGLKYRFDLTNPDIFTTWISSDGDTGDGVAIATIINLYFDLQKNTDNPPTIEAMIGFKREVFNKLKGFNPKVMINEGNDLVKKALKKGYHYELYKDPTYTFSLRRMRKQGSLKLFGNVALLEISRILGKKISNEKIRKLYPMKGGKFFEIERESENFFYSLLETIKIKKHSEKLIEFAKSLLFENESGGKK